MNLQTKVPLTKEKYKPIDYDANILLLGSCFSTNIGNKLAYYKFQTTQNPFGILFHPKAIESLLLNAINNKEYTEEDLFLLQERWHCFDAHSSLSGASKEELLHRLNTQLIVTHNALKNATHVCITLGTAWMYRFIATDSIVANCHKVPQKKFLKELLSVDETTESLEAIVTLITSINPKTTILFTISPVRHIKDGFIENQQSKAHLLSAVHQLINPRKHVHYMPSYEIMMDELRDYRFYGADMLHPNEIAINYIWEKFSEAWISDNALQTMKHIESIQRGLEHKPFNPTSDQHQQFLQGLQQKISLVSKAHSHIKFDTF